MRADAILLSQVPTTPMQHDPSETPGLVPIDQVRRQVAAALFGDTVTLPQVGRFQVAKLLGSGGMGVVYEAHDPQLGRKVALKLLQPLTSGERARERLLREAQAMAQLQHPNVVAVYEAGVHGDQVYVAMEYVENGTLAEWLRARPRSWQEVVAMLVQAGEGLMAAHAAGLVHRDFKPANILMSAGRARISDFGMARATTTAEDLERTADDSSGMLLGAPLTRTGALLGTPAYMAPEQLRGEQATPASDQFAFGVVLYESLYGHRPFEGSSVGALMRAVEAGKLARPARKVAVPSQLTAVIRRALAQDPARRYPDMAALVHALRAVPRFSGRPLMAAGLGASALVGGMMLVFTSQGEATTEAPQVEVRPALCGEGDALAGVWDAQRRGEVEQALAESGDTKALLALDEYAARWQSEHTHRCTAKVHDLRWTETCLADHREALADLAMAIVEAPVPVRAGAAGAATLLPAPSDCLAASRPSMLLSQEMPHTRALAWRLRLANAGAFGPHVAAHAPTFYRHALSILGLQELQNNRRSAMELRFADAVQRMHPESAPAPAWESKLLSPFASDARSRQPQDALPTMMDLGRQAEEAGYDDLAARSWVLAAELLEARPHADVVRQQVWDGATRALGRMSAGYPLWRSLTRDLGYVQLVHARHTTPAGTCFGADAQLGSCTAIFAAATSFKVIRGADPEKAINEELLARVYDHMGDAESAAAFRARNGRLDLDERTLGYLDFRAAEVVPDPPALEETVHCDPDATICQLDPTLVAEIERDPKIILGEARAMPSVKDGVVRGIKFYGLRPGNGVKQLGFRNGDLIVDIDGERAQADNFLASFTRVLTKGGMMTIERKGELSTRKFEVR